MNGLIIINKESGYTSHDVVAKMRGICKQRKIGHTGTLDPMATGVLPVCLGKATGVCSLLTDSDKEYRATFQLGIQTDTQDITGEILLKRVVNSTSDQITEAILSFVGKQNQIPPMYSALKINGQKLCDLARSGKTVDRNPRPIEIYQITIVQIQLPLVEILVSCSKGTYIRTLCHDIGEVLQCGACLTELVRTKAAGYSLDQAITLQQLQELKDSNQLEQVCMAVDSVFLHLPKVTVRNEYQKQLVNGNCLPVLCIPEYPSAKDGHQIRIYDESGQFVGVYAFRKEKNEWKPVKLFLER